MNKPLTQKGFAVLEALLLVIILAILGGTGYYVYQARNKTNDTFNQVSQENQSPTSSGVTERKSALVNSSTAGWKTYTNYDENFTLEIPAQIYVDNGSPCVQDNTIYDNYGNAVQGSKSSYRPKGGVVDATVVEDKPNYYVTQAYGYQLGGESNDASGHSYFSSCDKTTTTPALVKGFLAQKGSIDLDMIQLTVMNAADDQELLQDVHTDFNDSSLTITSKIKNTGGWYDLQLGCGQEMCQSIDGGKSYIRYYDTQKKFVDIELGNAGHLFDSTDKTAYGQQVADSFKFLN